LTTFQAVKAFDPTACGRCFGLKIPITVDNVLLDKAFFPFREIIDLEEIRAAKSFPLYHLNEKTIVGVLSLYFPKQLYIRNSKDIPVKHFNKIALFLHQLRENRFPNVAEKSSK